MQIETFIQAVTVLTKPNRCYEVGCEFGGRVIIEIKQEGSNYDHGVHSEYVAYDENCDPIVSIENAPVVVEYKTVVVDDK